MHVQCIMVLGNLQVAAQLEEAAGNSSRAADLFVRKNLSDRAAARRRRRLFESKKEMAQAGKEERGGRGRRKGGKQARRISTDNNLIGGVDYTEEGLGEGRPRVAVSDSEVILDGRRGRREEGRHTPSRLDAEDCNLTSAAPSSSVREEESKSSGMRSWRTLASMH